MQARERSARFQSGASKLNDYRARVGAMPPALDFVGHLRGARERIGMALIAEMKRASPSRGVLSQGFEAGQRAQSYQESGASAISILTEEDYFRGSLDDLQAARANCSLPLLRKDFLTEEWELWESRACGADAVLLIAALLAEKQLSDLLALSSQLGMAALVEVHTSAEMQTALSVSAPLIGINNRDLTTFTVDLAVTESLAPLAPPRAFVVSESGFSTRADVERAARAGAGAILVGESLMVAADAAQQIRRLLALHTGKEHV